MVEQIGSGIRQDITQKITEDGFKDTFYPAAVQNFSFDRKYYGLPNDVAPEVLFYNKELCQKAGVDPTQIHYWEDLIEAVKKCKAAGITPMAVGGKEPPSWVVMPWIRTPYGRISAWFKILPSLPQPRRA
jgi:raffinose/stachyose/melibiose transport system substrate-binding protein